MPHKFTFQKAKQYVSKIKSREIKNPFQNSDSVYSLKEFAKVGDEENFKVIINLMASFISKSKEGQLKLFKKDPLVFIECLILEHDHGNKAVYILLQRSRGLKVKKPSIKRTQKFFQKIYGSHFFKE